MGHPDAGRARLRPRHAAVRGDRAAVQVSPAGRGARRTRADAPQVAYFQSTLKEVPRTSTSPATTTPGGSSAPAASATEQDRPPPHGLDVGGLLPADQGRSRPHQAEGAVAPARSRRRRTDLAERRDDRRRRRLRRGPGVLRHRQGARRVAARRERAGGQVHQHRRRAIPRRVAEVLHQARARAAPGRRPEEGAAGRARPSQPRAPRCSPLTARQPCSSGRARRSAATRRPPPGRPARGRRGSRRTQLRPAGRGDQARRAAHVGLGDLKIRGRARPWTARWQTLTVS